MVSPAERAERQLRDIEFIMGKVAAAKATLKYGTLAWNELDLAEARLQGLSMFTSLGKMREEAN